MFKIGLRENGRIAEMSPDPMPNASGIEVGNKRSVKKILRDGSTFFQKQIQSSEEVKILRELKGIGFVEDMVEESSDTFLVKEVPGVPLDIFQIDFLGDSSKEIEDKALLQNFLKDYLAKSILLLCIGVFHNDNKIDNVFVESEGSVHFIDFGEATDLLEISSKNNKSVKNTFFANAYKYLDNIKVYNDDLQDSFQNIEENIFLQTAQMNPLVEAVFDYFIENQTPISQRLSIFTNTINSYPEDFKNFLEELGCKGELSEAILKEITTISVPKE